MYNHNGFNRHSHYLMEAKYEDQQQTLFDGRNEQGTEEAILQYGNRPGNEKSEQGGYPGRTTPEVPGKEGEINESQGLFGKEFGQQGELFAGGQKISKQKLPKSAKKKSKTDKLQGDLFSGMPTKEDQLSLFPAESGTNHGDGSKGGKSHNQRFVRVGVETTGNILSNGLAVESTADIAAIFSNLIKSPQKNLYTVTVDSAGNVLEVHKYSKGSLTLCIGLKI